MKMENEEKDKRIFKNIYILYWMDAGHKNVFYVGRTNNPKNRLSGHRSASKKGHEAKYQFIRALESVDISWKMEVIKTSEENIMNYAWEREYVIKYILDGHSLTNEKHGDLDSVKTYYEKNSNIRTHVEIEKDWEQKEEEARLRAERLRNRVKDVVVSNDPMALILTGVKKRGQVKVSILRSLKERGWVKNKKQIGCLSFERGKVDSQYYIKEEVSGVIAGPGKSYQECYDDIAGRVGEVK